MSSRKRNRDCNKQVPLPLHIYNLLAVGFLLVVATLQSVQAQQNSNNAANREGIDSAESRCPLASERQSWDNLSCDEQDAFLTNIRRLKRNGIYDTFVRVHIENELASHGTPEFLPWHRWFIYQFELALRSVADPPYKCMSLPYWDWELDAGNEGMSSVLSPETFSSFEGTNQSGRCKFQINRWNGAGSCLRRTLNSNFRFWGEGRVVAIIRGYTQYGDDFPNDRTRLNGFRAALEGGPHAAPHNFIGGSMVDQNAPNDPLFWIHHANVDRLWSIWQDYHGHTNISFRSYRVPKHYEGSLIDIPMPFGLTTSFTKPWNGWDFRIRNLRTPTPREVLSNDGFLIKVRYIHKNPVPSEPGYITNRKWFGTPPIQIDQCLHRLDINNPRRQLQTKSRTLEDEEDFIISQANTTYHNETPLLRGLSKKQYTKRQRLSIFPPRATNSINNDDKDIISVEECLRSNNFDRFQDRENWNKLCKNLPLTHSTLKERLNKLSFQDCEELGNPRSAVDDDWIERMGMSNNKAAFDCYHVADENERPSS